MSGEFLMARSPAWFRGSLPFQLSVFVGRRREQRELAVALKERRLVTLVGPGGMGKTRLGLEVAAGVAVSMTHGVCFVELAPVGEAAGVDAAVVSALGFEAQPGLTAREQLLEGLSDRQLLLVLDNCEHLLAPVGVLAAELLDRCRGVTVLATSRAPLRVAGEQVFQVGPLDLGNDAPALFVERARAVRPEFTLDGANSVVVRAICEQLDCMPLALELAAARVRSMTVRELLERLEYRFRLLRADRDTWIPRHATLTAVVEWSFDLLAAPAQRVLVELGVFVGGFDLAAAHAVAGRAVGAADELETLDLLDTLVDQSLVRAEEVADRTRYSMLETLRQYVVGRMSDEERNQVRARHAAYYLEFARAGDVQLCGAEQVEWLERLETEHDNLRAALIWALGPSGDPDVALALAGALWWFWRVRSHIEEGRRWYERVLALPSGSAVDRVRALTGAGLLGYFARTDDAEALLQRARSEAYVAGDVLGAAWAVHGAGRVALDRRDYDNASACFTESIELFERCGDRRGAVYSTYFAGSASSYQGDVATAERRFEEAERAFTALGDVWGLVGVAGVQAWHADKVANPSSAARHYGEQLSRSAQLGSRWMISLALFGLARAAAVLGEWRLAAELYGSARAVTATMGAQADRIAGTTEGRYLEQARQAIGNDQVEVAWTAGRDRTVEDAVSAAAAAAAMLATPRPVQSEPTGPAGVTDREWEVLQLLAEGRTNREIAGVLALSVRTVENHLAHVYAKVGVKTRVEATLFALQTERE